MAALATQISDFTAKVYPQLPPSALGTIQDWVGELSASGIESQSLQVGQAAPDFVLPDAYGGIIRLADLRAHGGIVRLADLRAHGPVVVVFYRGAWCPFCNLALRTYQRTEPEAILSALRAIQSTH